MATVALPAPERKSSERRCRCGRRVPTDRAGSGFCGEACVEAWKAESALAAIVDRGDAALVHQARRWLDAMTVEHPAWADAEFRAELDQAYSSAISKHIQREAVRRRCLAWPMPIPEDDDEFVF